jgi:hypothetical protein
MANTGAGSSGALTRALDEHDNQRTKPSGVAQLMDAETQAQSHKTH